MQYSGSNHLSLHSPSWRVYVIYHVRNIFLAAFSISLVFICVFLITFFLVLGFVRWFVFLGGVRCARFKLRVLKRMYQYEPDTYVR